MTNQIANNVKEAHAKLDNKEREYLASMVARYGRLPIMDGEFWFYWTAEKDGEVAELIVNADGLYCWSQAIPGAYETSKAAIDAADAEGGWEVKMEW